MGSAEGWRPWIVVPTSGFVVDDRAGEVAIAQIDQRHFVVRNAFRYEQPAVEEALIAALRRDGWDHAAARGAVDRARSFTPHLDNPTDLASIPRFLRWFENSYGRHSLAALIHDELITERTNGGALGSDVLADRFFREMMRTSDVPWLKRWIMWAGVALRTRWAAGGLRRASIVCWLLLSVAGITGFIWAAGSFVFGWPLPGLHPAALLTAALLLIFVAAPLWGRQIGAALIAAVAGFWVVPAALAAGLAWLTYLMLERGARWLSLT
ncbi:DUF1353 domain-containing protein [Gordonia sp. VNK21]|uniref:DUF1353 domain-containing protein n=1 Tax=Gordonia sp. VNK21 TaxID=3382483 RepID=UPI0038D4946F